MVKFKAQVGDRILLGFGLSEENIKKLKANQPIHVNLEPMGLNGIDLMICYGETEESIMQELSGAIGPDTTVRKDFPKIN